MPLDSEPTCSSSKKVFKIIVLGDTYVGKTSLTYRFCENKLLEKPEATIGVDFRERIIAINGEDIKLQIWDTAGQERFRKTMVNHYYRNTHGVIIVYDVTKMSSFKNVAMWLEECDSHNVSQIPRILVGNKCDCSDVEVSTNLAQKVAEAHGMPLFETSALTESESSNIDAIFLTLAHKLTRQQPLMPISKTASLDFQEHLQSANISLASLPSNAESSSCFC